MGDFDSAWRKWYWAGLHAKAYESDLERFATQVEAPPTLTVRVEFKTEQQAFAVIVDSITPLPTELGLRLGDVAHGYRSALDNLAWSLVQRGSEWATLTDDQKNRVGFPIVAFPGKFRRESARNLPGVLPADLAIVSRYQPYDSGQPAIGGEHCLTVLSRVNNTDKHRQIQPISVLPERFHYEVTHERDCTTRREPRRQGQVRPLHVNAELWLIPAEPNGPKPEIEVSVETAVQVAFEDGPVIVNWLAKTCPRIASLLREFSEPPIDLRFSV